MTTTDVEHQNRGNIEKSLRQLKRALERKGNLALAKQRKHHTKATTERKKAKAAAIKRHNKQIQKANSIMKAQRNSFTRGKKSS